MSHENLMIQMIKKAKQAFANNSSDLVKICDYVYLFRIILAEEEYKFFGVHKDQQKDINYVNFRKKLLKFLGYEKDTLIMEIIGDSKMFTKEGTLYAKSHFIEKIKQFNGVLLYGYTGYSSIDDSNELLDVNSIVNNYLDQNPNFATRVIGNLVDFHSRVALAKHGQPVPTLANYVGTGWGATGSKYIRNFILVWDDNSLIDNNFGARFGEDIIASDNLINCNESLLYAGGVQSFLQAINIMQNGYIITGINGISRIDLPSVFVEKHGKKIPILEAAEFFKKVKESYYLRKSWEENQSIKLNDLVEEQKEGKLFLSDQFIVPSWMRLDAISIFEKGLNYFIKNKIWNKIPALYNI